MNSKYKIRDDKRIEALRDFRDVKVGDLGGFVGSEKNLSHKGDCWVFNNAQISGKARISGDAKISEDACVYGNAQVDGNAEVYGNACVYGNALVCGDARVFGDAQVSGRARVHGNARISEDACVSGKAGVHDNARVYGNARVSDNAQVCGNAQVSGDAWVFEDTWEVSPLYIQGTRHSLTTCSHTEIAIGCERHTVETWLRDYKKIGRKNEYTEKEIKEYRDIIKFATKWLTQQFKTGETDV